MKGKEYFISGIDTGCGKTYLTGLLAYHLKKVDCKVITTKLVQTGCNGISEDILEHRKIMESDLLPEDESYLTCSHVFSFPASPHLAAKIEGKNIDILNIRNYTDQLLSNYEIILSEGAGGLMVPITENYCTIDYIKQYNLPLILVSSAKLGSINHTFMSINMCEQYNINLHAIIYNVMPEHDSLIANDTINIIKNYTDKKFPNTHIIHSHMLNKTSGSPDIKFLF